jgi:polysaccharide export outer membrane protein
MAGAILLLCLGEVEGYEIGAGDVLEVEIWQQPELSSVVTVYSDGTIVLPVVGSVEVEGITPAEAADLISRRFMTFNPRISQVAVRVTEFNSKSLYVLGEVADPGRYSFERIPDLVTVLSEAGGVNAAAALSEILILRTDSLRGRSLGVDVENLINQGNLSSLPGLRPGDVIWVPRRDGHVGESKVSIFGQVNNPGMYTIGSNTDLLSLILLAGGPREEADLGKVRLMRTGRGSTTINLDSYLDSGEGDVIPRLNPGDIIVVNKRSRFWSVAWGVFRETLAILGAGASLYLIYDTLQE